MKARTALAGLGTCTLALTLLAAAPARASITTVPVTIPAYIAPPGVAALSVTAGDTITISADGSAHYGNQGAGPCAGYPTTHPDGKEYLNGAYCGTIIDPNATDGTAPIGELLYKITHGSGWHEAGYSITFTAGATGTLYLLYNDSYYPDNKDSYTATVTDNSG